MLDKRVPRDRLCDIRQTDNQLDDLRADPACSETRLDPAHIPQAGPRDLFGALDNDGVSGKEAGEDGGEHVVEGVVP